jgi:diguanylate cyclase
LAAEEQGEIKQTLLKLLHLIIDNIGELSLDEQCVQGQIDSLVSAVSPPITLRRLDDVERRLQDVISRQREAKSRTLEAQEAPDVGGLHRSTGDDGQSNTDFKNDRRTARGRLPRSERSNLTPLLKRVIEATRGMAEDTAAPAISSRSCRPAPWQPPGLVRLHEELQHASASARHDR